MVGGTRVPRVGEHLPVGLEAIPERREPEVLHRLRLHPERPELEPVAGRDVAELERGPHGHLTVDRYHVGQLAGEVERDAHGQPGPAELTVEERVERRVQVHEASGCSWADRDGVISGRSMCSWRFASVPVPASRYRLNPSCWSRYPLVAVPSFGQVPLDPRTVSLNPPPQLHAPNVEIADLRTEEPFGKRLEERRIPRAEELVSGTSGGVPAGEPSRSSVAYTSLAVSSAEDTSTTSGPASSCIRPASSG